MLDLAAELKRAPYAAKPLAGPLSVAMIFDKPTLRTQVSFAAGIAELGGHPMLVDGTLAGIGKRESVADVARVLGRQAAAIVWRTYGQDAIEEMAAYSGVPVVNALTDEFHPCQLLADLLTVREHKGTLAGLTVAFVGDGACNMGNSWLLAGATAGMHVRISAPEGQEPEQADGRPGATASGRRPAAPRCSSATRSRPSTAPTWWSPTPGSRWARRARPRRRLLMFARLHRHRRADGARRARRDRDALPAGLPRQGDRRRRARRPAERGLGRGREPAARPEGDHHLAPGAAR